MLKVMMVAVVCLVAGSWSQLMASNNMLGPEPANDCIGVDVADLAVDVASEAEVVTPVAYQPSYASLWYVNGSMDPDYQRSHLLNDRNHSELDDAAIMALTDQEVLATHASHHEGRLNVARFNAYFGWRGQPSRLASVAADCCPNGLCPTGTVTYTSEADCPTGACPTVTYSTSGSAGSCPTGSCPNSASGRVFSRTRSRVRSWFPGRLLGFRRR